MTGPLPARIEVAAPPVEPYRYGLLSAATIAAVPDGQDRWQGMGVVYMPDGCAPSGGLWPDPCVPPVPVTEEIQAYEITFTKPAGADNVVGTLTARHPGYGAAPVLATVDGVELGFVAVGQQRTWPVAAETSVDVSVTNTANGPYPLCSTAVSQLVIPATGVAMDPVLIECLVDADIPPDELTKNPVGTTDFVEGAPFQVYESNECVTLGFDEGLARATRRLSLHEQWHVERHVDATVFRTDVEVLNGGNALELLAAIGLLEDVIADRYGGIGVLHVARDVYPYFLRDNLIRRDAARNRTPLDNLWAIGAGYSNTSPAGVPAPDGQAWVYATGPVTARRSNVFSREEFNRERNIRLAVAERVFALTFDCLRVAVLAQLPVGSTP